MPHESGDAASEDLPGGSVTGAVRVGETVRRRTDRWSRAVHELLLHLERIGFDGAPRFLGIDDEGREVLSWIEGTPAMRPWPKELLGDSGLIALARLLRRFHDTVASYQPPPNAEWWTGSRTLRDGEIVCHGDLGPWNTIWRDGAPVAFIDWDFAEPNKPIRDVAEAAFFAVPMRDDDHCRECGFATPPDRRVRLETFLDAYGLPELATSAVIDEAEAYWEEEIATTRDLGPRGVRPWDNFLARGLIDAETELLRWLRANRHRLA